MILLNIVLLILSVLLVTAILLQSSSAGLGGALGGGEGFHIRRGSEKRIFQATIVLATLFVLTAIAHLFVS